MSFHHRPPYQGPSKLLLLQANDAPEQQLVIRTLQPPGSSKPLDMAVAARDLAAGDVALSIPDHLTVTLDRVFEDNSVADLLTTGGPWVRLVPGAGQVLQCVQLQGPSSAVLRSALVERLVPGRAFA